MEEAGSAEADMEEAGLAEAADSEEAGLAEAADSEEAGLAEAADSEEAANTPGRGIGGGGGFRGGRGIGGGGFNGGFNRGGGINQGFNRGGNVNTGSGGGINVRPAPVRQVQQVQQVQQEVQQFIPQQQVQQFVPQQQQQRQFTRNTGFSSGGSRSAGTGVGSFGGGQINVQSFGNIDSDSFGFDNFGGQYVDVDKFDFNNARSSAQALAPRESINQAQQEQIVIGKRFRSGYARQTETSSAVKEGTGSGEAGIELAASRTANQDATQQFKQDASGEGKTEQGAGYGFERNNKG
ncbi:PREDICTED: protein PopA1-like [Priapulus caudatus]|uniref:Protein PopA1-like n=1 Tax=Priapulus caudatus TaxID=37621 RepID=A0ABM1FAJ0_PRICU|nr:PREDICTED: protein PopA1-like [Priapulus caudatus]